jgi:hypothetical protein
LITQSNSYAVIHTFRLAKALEPWGRQANGPAAAKERTMSLANCPSLNKSKAFEGRLYRMPAAIGRRSLALFEAIAEARMHSAMIEAELYLKRYKHSSKNDDDLPVL